MLGGGTVGTGGSGLVTMGGPGCGAKPLAGREDTMFRLLLVVVVLVERFLAACWTLHRLNTAIMTERNTRNTVIPIPVPAIPAVLNPPAKYPTVTDMK